MSGRLRFATLLLALCVWAVGASAAWARQATRVVSYHGFTLHVPASWPVYDLASEPRVCVRFDRHAVYLGRPGVEEQCPAHVLGRTEAILVAPLSARAARSSAVGGGGGLTTITDPLADPPQGSSAQLALPRQGLAVTATWRSEPGVVARTLGRRSLPPAPSPSALGGQSSANPSLFAHASQAKAHPVAVYKGLGFDDCSAPSPRQMSAWLASPFRAVGIYLGGTNMACAQSSLSAAWVARESAAGWHLIPTYVGLQAPRNSCGCLAISPGRASSEGSASARDAVIHARALGIGSGNPIYFDLEAYRTGRRSTAAVLAFLSAWTSTLHREGYVSGVYANAFAGVGDLVRARGTRFREPDDLWVADWNGRKTAGDPYVPGGDWPRNQRLHQFRGPHDDRYGGVRMNIDSDYVDGATVGATHASVLPAPAIGKLHCVVPKLWGRTLRQATRALRKAHCALGKVTRPRHVRRRHRLHVVAQSLRGRTHHPAGFPIRVFLH